MTRLDFIDILELNLSEVCFDKGGFYALVRKINEIVRYLQMVGNSLFLVETTDGSKTTKQEWYKRREVDGTFTQKVGESSFEWSGNRLLSETKIIYNIDGSIRKKLKKEFSTENIAGGRLLVTERVVGSE